MEGFHQNEHCPYPHMICGRPGLTGPGRPISQKGGDIHYGSNYRDKTRNE